jgi:uncharacterized protein YndB with AHSA1/START domain
MARNEQWIDAPPERVFEVLTDPHAYPEWVVGASETRDADAGFPAEGTSFYPRVGIGPAQTQAVTTVEQLDPPRRLVLRADAGAFGAARISFDLEPSGGGTQVTLREVADTGSTLARAATDVFIALRNVFSLERLREVV